MKVDKKGKYYTPTIEEFHIGFEYEEFCSYPIDSNGEWMSEFQWYKKIVKDYGQAINNWDKHHPKDFVYIPITGRYYNDGIPKENFNIENIFRVKYLDQEDIESLGFIADKERHWGYRELYIKGDYCIKIMLPNREIIIQTIDKEKEPEYFGNCKIPKLKTIFDGNIKNKSELIKLLKQLGINE